MSDVQERLLRYCRRDKTIDAINILSANNDLDLTVKDGNAFVHATKHGNSKLLGALLEYYKTHKLQGDRESEEYKAALAPFRQIIDNLASCYNLEEKGVKKVLEPYLDEEEDSYQAAVDDAIQSHCSEELDHQAPPPEDNFHGWPAGLSYGAAGHGELSGNHHELVEAH